MFRQGSHFSYNVINIGPVDYIKMQTYKTTLVVYERKKTATKIKKVQKKKLKNA